MKEKPASVEAYLAAVPPDQRAALEVLRKTIRSVAPSAAEKIAYGIPIFVLNGHLVGYGAAKKHCAFYVMSSKLLLKYAAELEGYSTSTGTIRFQPESPLPIPLVKRLVKARLAENQS